MYGAAWATVIGQIISAAIAIRYLMHYHTVTLEKQHFIPSGKVLAQICSLGMSSGINQIAMMIVQIVMNNLLKHYGAQSVYVVTAMTTPRAHRGCKMQRFNYGAKQYKRVKDAFLLAASVGAVVSIISFLLFQLFPRQILGLFGSGSEEYFEFGVNYFRAFLFFTWLNFLQPISSMFFSSIGKAYKGTFLSLPRQILFLLPLIVALPHFFGIMGVLYAGPIADLLSFAVGLSMVIVEFKHINKLEAELA